MAAPGKKKQDELNLKVLRELTALEHNKKCLECGQRGITYADMTTAGFVCVQCSGYLRGLNPPHRVKSISMTSFLEKELLQLKDGGNEVARNVWLGKWNSAKDREPNRKEEDLFKEFLCTKYERRQWYKSPTQVRKDEASKSEVVKTETKLLPPPSSKHVSVVKSQTTQVTPLVIQTCTIVTTPISTPASTTSASKVDLLGDLAGDPFASKKPVGAVAVMTGLTGATLTPSNGLVKQDGFGDFTQAPPASSSSSFTSLTLPPSSSSSSIGGKKSGGDIYAELACLDSTFRELRLKDEPSSTQVSWTDPVQSQSTQSFGGAGSGFGGAPGSTNPFVSPQSPPQAGTSGTVIGAGIPQTQSNPFLVAGGQPPGVQGGNWMGAQGPPSAIFAQQTGQMPGVFVGAQIQQQQQQQQQQQRFVAAQGMVVGGGAGFNQSAAGQFPQQQQQWGVVPQQQPQAFVMHGVGVGGVAPAPQMQWGGVGGGMQQIPPQQQQWRAQQIANPQGIPFSVGVQQPGSPVVVGGFSGVMQQQQQHPQQNQQFGGFVSGNQMPMQQQQQNSANQFNWSGVDATIKQKAPSQKKIINWGGGASRIDNLPSGGSFATSASSNMSSASGVGGGDSAGWSNQLTKPVTSSWGAPAQQQGGGMPMGWSSDMGLGGGDSSAGMQQANGANWASNFGGGGGISQPQQSVGMGFGGTAQQNQMGGANPFTATSQSGPTNPFL